jgi:bifunctional DNA-binding transcriptional regulator/antitoxin component of YhaV-PrlF toxin-antitoxin module
MSSKNQVTIPVEALSQARLRPGDELRVTADRHGRLILTAVRDALDDLIGSAPDLSADTDLETLRAEWDR